MLSYPGVAFSFTIPESARDRLKGSDDFISYLSGATTPRCTSMALFKGGSWAEVKDGFFTEAESMETVGGGETAIHYADIDVCTVFWVAGWCANGLVFRKRKESVCLTLDRTRRDWQHLTLCSVQRRCRT